ncbi:MAG: hypothetical protein L3J82_09385 [Planctomycetes bacterium]|nr:hypothetical protein [Planctomycetota bacterium]
MLKITALLIMAVALLCGSLSAQGGLEVKTEGGKTTLSGDLTDIPLEDLIRLACEQQKIRIIYDPKKVTGTVTFLAPKGGFEVSNGALFSLLQLGLKQFRLTTLTPFGTDSGQSTKIYEITPASEAITTNTPVIFLEDIDDWTDTTDQYITLVANLKYAEANSVRGALQNMTSRQGGQVNPVAGVNVLLISDYADNIRRLAKIIKTLDVPNTAPKLEYIELAHAAPESVANEINGLMQRKAATNNQRPRRPCVPQDQTIVEVQASSAGNAIIVSGYAAGIDIVRELLKKMDAPSSVDATSSQYNYYKLKHANADNLAKVINSMLGNDEDADTSKKTSERLDHRGQVTSRNFAVGAVPIVSADANTNSLLINASRENYLEIKALIEQLDVAPAAKTSSSTEKKSSGCAAGSGGSGIVLLGLLAALVGVLFRRRKLA